MTSSFLISLIIHSSQSWAPTIDERLNELFQSPEAQVKTRNLSKKTDAEVCGWAADEYGWSTVLTEYVKEAKSRNYTYKKCIKINWQNTSDKQVCKLSESYNLIYKNKDSKVKEFWLKEANIRENRGLNCKVCNYKNFDIKKDYLEAHFKQFSDNFKKNPNLYYEFNYPLHCTNYYILFMEGFYFFMQKKYFMAESSFYSLIKYNNENDLLKKSSFNSNLINWSKIYSVLAKHKMYKYSKKSERPNLCQYYKQPLFKNISNKFKNVIRNTQIRDKCVEGEEKGISLDAFYSNDIDELFKYNFIQIDNENDIA